MKIKKSGLVLASTAAALLASGFAMTASAVGTAKVKCQGINKCMGQGDCDPSKKGQNKCAKLDCTLVNTVEECTNAGGTVMPEAPAAPAAQKKP